MYVNRSSIGADLATLTGALDQQIFDVWVLTAASGIRADGQWAPQSETYTTAAGVHNNTALGSELPGFGYLIGVTPVPEPSTYALLALGALACGHTARKRRKKLQKAS